MKINLAEKSNYLEQQLARLNHESSRLISAVSEAAEDVMLSARRELKRGYYKAEELADEAVYSIKHNPMRSVALAFGAGAVLGWLVTRNGNRHQ